MIKTVLKAGFSKPATRRYPFEKREPIKDSRGALSYDKTNCTYCMICEKKCPTNAITVDRPGRVWTLNRFRCISCNACCEACPQDCLVLKAEHNTVRLTNELEVIKGEPLPPKSGSAPAAEPAPEA
jgi:formate hydrogenlyase subunit 6/NADH:ubiquinone oxidoreductase subunit I